MEKNNSYTKTIATSAKQPNAPNIMGKREEIKVIKEYKWTANIHFVSHKSEQKDRAYRNWVQLFLRSKAEGD